MKKIFLIVISVIALVGVAVGGYFLINFLTKPKENTITITSSLGGYVKITDGDKTFNIDENTSSSFKFKKGTIITVSAIANDDYKLSELKINDEITTTKTSDIIVNKNYEVKANFVSTSHSVNLKNPDDESVATFIVKESQNLLSMLNAKMIEMGIQPETGYEFKYYVDDAIINSNTILTKSSTITYRQTPIVYTVTFKNGETVVGSDTYTVEDKTITAPVVPTIAGYTTSWEAYNLDELGNKTVNLEKTLIEYTVTFKNGEEVVRNVTYSVENKTITEPKLPVIAGYTTSWEAYNLDELGDKTVNLVKTVIEYTVTFKNGEEVVRNVTYSVENKTITEPELPVIDGYTTNDGYTTSWEAYNLDELGDKTVDIVKTPIEYTITFKNGEEVVENVTYSVENKTITKPELPVIAGYTTSWEAYNLDELGDKTVNLVKTLIVYTVTFKNGEEVVRNVTYSVENKTITEPEAPVIGGTQTQWENYDLDVLGNKTVYLDYKLFDISYIGITTLNSDAGYVKLDKVYIKDNYVYYEEYGVTELQSMNFESFINHVNLADEFNNIESINNSTTDDINSSMLDVFNNIVPTLIAEENFEIVFKFA